MSTSTVSMVYHNISMSSTMIIMPMVSSMFAVTTISMWIISFAKSFTEWTREWRDTSVKREKKSENQESNKRTEEFSIEPKCEYDQQQLSCIRNHEHICLTRLERLLVPGIIGKYATQWWISPDKESFWEWHKEKEKKHSSQNICENVFDEGRGRMRSSFFWAESFDNTSNRKNKEDDISTSRNPRSGIIWQSSHHRRINRNIRDSYESKINQYSSHKTKIERIELLNAEPEFNSDRKKKCKYEQVCITHTDSQIVRDCQGERIKHAKKFALIIRFDENFQICLSRKNFDYNVGYDSLSKISLKNLLGNRRTRVRKTSTSLRTFE